MAIIFLFQYKFVLMMVSSDRTPRDDEFEYKQAYILFRNKKFRAEKRLRTYAKMMRVQNTSGAITLELYEISFNVIAFWNCLLISFNLSY